MRVIGIDPGSVESAYALIDSTDCSVIEKGKLDNQDLIARLTNPDAPTIDAAGIEWIESMGMAVGASVFTTCRWVGRFEVAIEGWQPTVPVLIGRHRSKLHHCGSRKAKDANIIQALIDRFAPDEPNRGKGTKAVPGWFYGFAADVWQAYALAVVLADQIEGREGVA